MTMAYPNALFPFLAAELHASWAVGLMFACPSVGAVAVTVTSGWMGRVRRHGLGIALAAGVWGLTIVAFGLAPDIGVALSMLVLAGAADMVSGIFRDTLWNQTIPDALRGRPEWSCSATPSGPQSASCAREPWPALRLPVSRSPPAAFSVSAPSASSVSCFPRSPPT